MTRGLHSYRYYLRFCLILGLAALPFWQAGAQRPDPVSGPEDHRDGPPEVAELWNGYRITFEGVSYRAQGESTWSYRVERTFDRHHPHHWVLSISPCMDILSAEPGHWHEARPDHHTRLSGIRWHTHGNFSAGTFSVTVSGQRSAETSVLAVRSGPNTAYGEIAGPGCGQNRPPEAENDDVSTNPDGVLEIPVLSNDRDPDGDDLHLADFQTTSDAGGAVTRRDMGTPDDLRDDRLVYTPAPGFAGADRFSYTLSDGLLDSTGTVLVQVNTPAAPSIANSDTYTVSDSRLEVPAPGVMENDSYPDWANPRVRLADRPRHGDLDLERDGSFTYEPDEDFVGEDRFTYRVRMGPYSSNTAVVTLLVEDLVPPRVSWVSPVPEGERVDVLDGQEVDLEVEAADNRAVDRVVFVRWDAVNEVYITIDEQRRAPYEAEVEAEELNPGWNQVFAVVYDISENRGPDTYIWLFRSWATGGGGTALYLPLIGSGP